MLNLGYPQSSPGLAHQRQRASRTCRQTCSALRELFEEISIVALRATKFILLPQTKQISFLQAVGKQLSVFLFLHPSLQTASGGDAQDSHTSSSSALLVFLLQKVRRLLLSRMTI